MFGRSLESTPTTYRVQSALYNNTVVDAPYASQVNQKREIQSSLVVTLLSTNLGRRAITSVSVPLS